MEKLVQQIIDYFSTVPRPKNWVLMLVSLLIALFLWYFVVGEDKVDMTVSIPVEILNLPRDLTISNKFKKQLEVTVSGQRSLIRAMANQDISRAVDLSDAKPGAVVIHNTPESISLPRGISVLRIQPTTLTLLLDRLIHKKLPIQPVINGRPTPGHELESVILEPPSIEISGPESVLESEEFIETKPMDISNLKDSTTRQIALNVKPEIAELIGEPVVTAHVKISEKHAERIIPDIQVEFDDQKFDAVNLYYLIIPEAVTVRAELPVSLILETDDLTDLFGAGIEPDSLAPGNTRYQVNVDAPATARILEVMPPDVTLRIVETPKKKFAPDGEDKPEN